MRYLEAIDADDYRRLPGGIFNRSFIRAYAKHVGYDEQQALEEYSTMMHERGESTDEVSNRQPRALVYTDNGGSRAPLLTVLLAVIILAILSLGAWAAWYFYKHRIRQKTQAPSHASQKLAMGRNLTTISECAARMRVRAKLFMECGDASPFSKTTKLLLIEESELRSYDH